MLLVRGKLIDPQGNKYTGHRVLALYREKVQLSDSGTQPSDPQAPIWRPVERGTDVADDGAFSLTLPDKEQLDELITLKVIAPDGEVLLQKNYSVDELADELAIAVPAKTFFPVPVRDGPLTRVKITGRVLDAAGKQQVANRQLVLWARPQGAGDNSFMPVLATRTDSQGYFSADYPLGKYEEAYGVVSVGENERVPILLEDGTFPRNVLLVVEVAEDLAGPEDVRCHGLRTAMP